MNMTQNTTQHLDLNYCPPPPPPLPVFEEELIVFNACPTCKLTKFQREYKGNDGKFHKYALRYISHNPWLKKNGSSKIYKLHFKGNFYRFMELMTLLSDYGLTWMRNRWWYRNEKTGENFHPSNFLLIDFDDLGIITGAELMQYNQDNVKTCLAIKSSSNETDYSFEEEFIEEFGDNVGRFVAEDIKGKTKFHVLLKTEPFDFDNDTLRDKISEETSRIFSFYGMDSNTWKVAQEKQEKGKELSIAELYALETAWDSHAARTSQKTFSALNPALLAQHPKLFYRSYKAESEIGVVYTLNDFPSIFKGLAECVNVEPLLQFPSGNEETPSARIKQKQDIANTGINPTCSPCKNEDSASARIKQQQDITETGINLSCTPSGNEETPSARIKQKQDITNTGLDLSCLPCMTEEFAPARIKQQRDKADYKTWFRKRELYSDDPFILISASRILKEIVDRKNLPREASYPIAHWENTYLKQNKENPIRIGSRHKIVDLQIIALCYNARALASYFNIDLDTDSTLSYDGIIRQINWIVRNTTENSGADEQNPMNFTWIAQKVHYWLLVATTEEMAKGLSETKMRMDTRIVPNWDINLDEFEQLCSSESSTKEECFQAANAKWRISKAVFNGLWRRAGIAQKQAHRPRTRRCKRMAPSADESPAKGVS